MSAILDPQTAGKAVVLGAVLLTYAYLCRVIRQVNRPADEAYRDGFDAGHDKGWREGRASMRPRVVRLHNAR
jgi:hypothetical protein